MHYTAGAKFLIQHNVPKWKKVLINSLKWPQEHVAASINTDNMISKQQKQLNLSIMAAPSCNLKKVANVKIPQMLLQENKAGAAEHYVENLVCTLENSNVVSICSKSVFAIGSKSTNLLRQLRTYMENCKF